MPELNGTISSNQPSGNKPQPTAAPTGYNTAGGGSNPTAYASGSPAPQPPSTGASNFSPVPFYSNIPYSGGPSALVSQPQAPSTRDGGGYTYESRQPMSCYQGTCCGCTCATFVSLFAAVIYLVCAIVFLSSEVCAYERDNIFLFAALWFAIIAIGLMAGLNTLEARYKNNFFGQTILLAYSGSIALIASGLYMTNQFGVCSKYWSPKMLAKDQVSVQVNTTSMAQAVALASKVQNLDWREICPVDIQETSHGRGIWWPTLFGFLFQLCAYYFYG